jgi:septal ring factor EnvC (AmiA/AmiB activator)
LLLRNFGRLDFGFYKNPKQSYTVFMKKQATKKTYSEDYVGAMLEEIRSDFKVFGEGLNGVQKSLNDFKAETEANFETLFRFRDETKANFETLFEFRDETKANFEKLFEFKAETKDNFSTTLDYLSRIDDEITDIRAELEKGKKAGKMEESWFKKIEQRVSIIEKQLKNQKSLAIK